MDVALLASLLLLRSFSQLDVSILILDFVQTDLLMLVRSFKCFGLAFPLFGGSCSESSMLILDFVTSESSLLAKHHASIDFALSVLDFIHIGHIAT